MDQELIAYLDRRFERMDARFEQMDARFERLEEEIRHTRVEVEGLRGQIQLLAEGMISFDERLTVFKGELTSELANIRSLLSPLYGTLQDRVRALESWRETKERDPIEIIKERFGLQGRQGLQSQAG